MNLRLTEFLNTLKISRFLLLALFFTLIFGFFSSSIKDPDFWWHLKSGEYIYSTGSLPESDPFSYASLPEGAVSNASGRIHAILTQYWLAQVFFYLTYDLAGFQGIILMRAFLLALLVFLLYRAIRKEGLGLHTSIVLTVPLVMVLQNFTAEKPQLFSYLFAFLLIYLIEGFRSKETGRDSGSLMETRGENEIYRDSSGLAETNSPLIKGDKGGCSNLHENISDIDAEASENEIISKQPPAPPLLRGNSTEVSPDNSAESVDTCSAPPLMGGDKGEGETLSEDHPHPRIEYGAGSNPPPSMGREVTSVPVSNSLNQSQSVSGLYYLIPIPFIMLVWANMHSGFIAGVLIIMAYLIAEPAKYALKRFGKPLSAYGLRLLMVVGVVSVLTTLANPNGYNLLPFMIQFESTLYPGFIPESASPLEFLRMGYLEMQTVIYFVLLGINILLFTIRIRKLDLTDAVMFAAMALISLSSSRAIPFFCAVSILMIVRYGQGVLAVLPIAGRLNAPPRLAELFTNIAASAVVVLILIYGSLFQSGVRANVFPEGAAQFLRDNRPSGNMFNPYTWGGYLMWSLSPEYKVFTDGRRLIQEVFFQQIRIMDASPTPLAGIPEWKAILNAYRVNFIVTYSVRSDSGRLVPLISALFRDPEWHLVFMDNISLIFLRVTPENRDLILRFGMPKAWLWNEVAVEAGLKAKSYPWNVNFYITMGDAFYAKGSFAEAKNAYQKALERDPESAAARKRMELLREFG